MRYKILAGVLVLGLIISLGFNIYYYSAMVDKQAIINNMRGHIIVAWAEAMSIAGYYLKNATTNIDLIGVREILRAAEHIGEAGWESGTDLYWQMSCTPGRVEENFAPYTDGAPTTVKHINPTAIEMFENLTEKIWDVTHLVLKERIEVTKRKGINPSQLLEEKGVLDDIINYCIDIRNLSQQIYDFSPKF